VPLAIAIAPANPFPTFLKSVVLLMRKPSMWAREI
jgi:hypothetical protein